MRKRTITVLTLILAALVAAAPGSAHAGSGGDGGDGGGGARGWEPAPQASWDLPAGVRCDFAVAGEPVVDEVRKLALPGDRELYLGDLILEVTNTETGAVTEADASGTAMIEYGADGSQTWYVTGPVLVGFGEDAGTLPRGIYIIDGQYVLEIAADGYRTVTMVHGTTRDLCADLA